MHNVHGNEFKTALNQIETIAIKKRFDLEQKKYSISFTESISINPVSPTYLVDLKKHHKCCSFPRATGYTTWRVEVRPIRTITLHKQPQNQA